MRRTSTSVLLLFLQESISCVEELGAQTESDLLVECSINHVLERSVLARKGAGHLLAELVKRKLLPLDKYTKGLTAVLEFADDLAIDIPNVWQYFGELIGPVFCEGGVSLTELDSLTTVVKDTGKQAVVIRHILEEASHKVVSIRRSGRVWDIICDPVASMTVLTLSPAYLIFICVSGCSGFNNK